MFYKHDIGIIRILLSILYGLKKNFDCVLIITGDTGTGKSMWVLHLIEAWQKILGKKITAKTISQVNVEKMKWLEEFKVLEKYDINVFDEGAAGLGSKQYMETFSKTLEMLFQVVRYKRFFTVIVVPNFFRLNKFFREDRLRGMIYIDRRGHYRFYTRKQVVKLSLLNERRIIKNMNLISPHHHSSFPDYEGVLLKAYDSLKKEGVDNILEEVIELNKPKSQKMTLGEISKDDVKKLLDKKMTHIKIREKLGIGGRTLADSISIIRTEEYQKRNR